MPRWAIAVAIVVALVPASYFTAHRVFQDSSASPGDTSTDLPIPPVSPSATNTATQEPTATPSKTSTPVPKLPKVAPDAPRRITAGAFIDSGFDDAATEIDASTTSEVTRLESRGSPGSPGTDTVYVIGRVHPDGESAFAGLPRLKAGAKVSIRTDKGTLTYTVSATKLEAESRLTGDPLFRVHRAGGLVLVGIRYDASGDRLDKALVVTAQLTGAKKA